MNPLIIRLFDFFLEFKNCLLNIPTCLSHSQVANPAPIPRRNFHKHPPACTLKPLYYFVSGYVFFRNLDNNTNESNAIYQRTLS